MHLFGKAIHCPYFRQGLEVGRYSLKDPQGDRSGGLEAKSFRESGKVVMDG